jgi:hypothetical protein
MSMSIAMTPKGFRYDISSTAMLRLGRARLEFEMLGIAKEVRFRLCSAMLP